MNNTRNNSKISELVRKFRSYAKKAAELGIPPAEVQALFSAPISKAFDISRGLLEYTIDNKPLSPEKYWVVPKTVTKFKPVNTKKFKKHLFYGRLFLTSITKYFYRKGLSSQAQKIFFKALTQIYYEEKNIMLLTNASNQTKNTKIQFSFSTFFNKLMATVNRINVPIKLTPKFIRRRIRKIPTYANLRFQQARTWRALSLIGKNTYSRSLPIIHKELQKLYRNEPGSFLISKLPDIYREFDRGRVYVRLPRFHPPFFKVLVNSAKHDKSNKHLPASKWRDRSFVRMQAFMRRRLYSKVVISYLSHFKRLKRKFFKNLNSKSMLTNYIRVFYKLPIKLNKVNNAN